MALDPSLARLQRERTWRTLTAVETKFQYFSRETYFREGWETAQDALGPHAASVLQRVAAVTLKPDCIIGRKASACLQYLVERGFRPVIAQPFWYTRHNTREIWRFQWNIATLDRLRLGDLVHTAAKSLLMLLVDEQPEAGLPATVRLAGLKGSSIPCDRNPDELRSRLGALNRMLVFVHCSDEPIDVVRELAIIFPPHQLVRIYRRLGRAIAGRGAVDVEVEVERLHRRFRAGPVDIVSALDAFAAGLARQRARDSSGLLAAKRLQAAMELAQEGIHLNWPEWVQDLRAAQLTLDPWVPTVVASHWIQHDVPGASCVIAQSGRKEWLAGEGLFCDG